MKKILFLSFGIVTLFLQTASADLFESWENTLDGWTVNPLGKNVPFNSSFSTTIGVTEGSYSLALSGTANPNYTQMLSTPASTNLTAMLGEAVSISFDVYAPTGSFGGYLQIDVDLDNADTTYVSLDNYQYLSAFIGGETNLVIPIPAGIQAQLALSANTSQLYIQIGGGYTPGNETMYLDNFRINFPPDGTVPTPTKPSTLPTNTFYAFSASGVTLSESSRGQKPLFYQWETDGAGGGSLTNIPDATNRTYVFNTTIAGTYKFDVIVSNNFNGYSAVTSAVAQVIVLPASVPILTSDITPTNIYGFIGGNVSFFANFALGTMPVTNQWLFNNGTGYAPVAGVGNNPWTCTNVQSSSAGYYKLSATNLIGSSNSSAGHLTALADPGAPANIGTNMYAYCVYTNNPWAYWKFEETQNTLTNSMQAYDYSGHNFDATYGNSDGTAGSGCLDGGENISLNGQHGPNPNDYLNGYPGLPSTNGCAGLSYNYNNGYLTVPPLNLNTNAVTFTMWIYPIDPSGVIAANTGLLMNRNGSDVAGVGFSGNQNANLTAALGYTWNTNGSTTYTWNSHLFPVPQQWSFVAYVISPQNTTIYLYYVSGGKTNLTKAVNNVANAPEAFSGGTTWLGGDNNNNGQTFYGSIDEVAVFNKAMNETQIQSLFLRALGLTNGVAPNFTQQPVNTQVFSGQVLQIPSLAGGIPNPSYQWQLWTGAAWANANNNPATGIFGATNATFGWTGYSGAFTNFRCIAYNAFGTNISSSAWASVIPVANWNKGLWTVNFDVPSSSNGGPDTNYVGRGVLTTSNSTWNSSAATNVYGYWNALSGGNFANTPPSLLDDGVTRCPVNLGATNSGNGTWYNAGSHLLLDQYMNFGANGTSMLFTDVPNGKYNLAVYMTDAGPQPSYADRGTTVTVKGVSQSITNAQDVALLPDNTVIYTNLVVTNGMLEMHLQPYDTPLHTPNNEGDFNGAQLQLLQYGPNILSLTNKNGNFVLTYVGGKLLEATNITGPWTTNTAVPSGAVTINPTGQMKFYRVLTNTAWE